jgi:hypothetical protein
MRLTTLLSVSLAAAALSVSSLAFPTIASAAESDVYVAADAPKEPKDWAILYAGLRPDLGTFGGVATLSLADAHTRRFYGVASVGGVKDEVDRFVGGAQVTLGHAHAHDLYGAAQIAISHAEAGDLRAPLQLSLAYAEARSFGGALQLAPYARSGQFAGLAQVGVYDRVDDGFVGGLELGVVSSAGKPFDFDGPSETGTFTGIAQIGALSWTSRRFVGITQIGAESIVAGDFIGLVQIGGLAAGTKGTFNGLAQLGGVGTMAGTFNGLAQLGGGNVVSHLHGSQIGVADVALEDASGLQLGAVTYAKELRGAQVGVVNWAEDARGVQIGLVNHARSLHGVQIGLLNHADRGAVAEWTALLNIGFGAAPEAPPIAPAPIVPTAAPAPVAPVAAAPVASADARPGSDLAIAR